MERSVRTQTLKYVSATSCKAAQEVAAKRIEANNTAIFYKEANTFLGATSPPGVFTNCLYRW